MSSNRYDGPTAESSLADAMSEYDQPTAPTVEHRVRVASADLAADTLAPSACAPVQQGLPALGTVIVNKYVLERLLGQGGMGAVFAARHLITNKRVAVKWLRDDPEHNRDAAARLAREARAAGRINHPNVVDIYDAGFSGRHPFMVMELLEGEPLDARIARAPLSVSETVDLMLPVLRGVSAAHASGIVHRDLKPGNIFLCLDPESGLLTPKVLDFGVSKLSVGVEEDLTVTSTGMQVGTPAFMAPEQVRGEAVDARSDVYALSVTLYQTLTGRLPFEGRVRHELFSKVLSQRARPPSSHRRGLPPRLDALILRGLERDPRRRFATVQELADALASYQTRRRWWRWPFEQQHLLSRRLIGSLLVLVLLTGVWFSISTRQRHERARSPAAPRAVVANLQTMPAEVQRQERESTMPATADSSLDTSTSPAPADERVATRPRRRTPRTKPRSEPAPVLEAPSGERPLPDQFMSW